MRLRNIFIVLMLFVASSVAQAQLPKQNRARARWDRFQEERMSAITTAVKITDAEQQTLTALFAEIDTKRIKIWAQIREIGRKIQANRESSDEEYSALLDKMIELDAQQNRLNEELDRKIASSFAPRKAYEIFVAHKHFVMAAKERIKGGANAAPKR